MSMINPVDPDFSISSKISFWNASTTVSWRSIWILARRVGPIFRMGMDPAMASLILVLRLFYRLLRSDLLSHDAQGELDAFGKLRSGIHAREFHSELNNRSRNRRRDAREHCLGPQQ